MLRRRSLEEAPPQASGQIFAVRGVVMQGDWRGRELGYPTANVPLHGGVVPRDGVYAGWLRIVGTNNPMAAAISVGTNQTFAGDRERRIESYVLDRLDLDLYGLEVEIAFLARIRGQRRFGTVEELVATIADDAVRVRDVLKRQRRPVG